MGKVSKKKKSKNTKPTLSDIVPALAHFDKFPKQVTHSQLLPKARIIAQYSKEKKLSEDTKRKIKSFFSHEHLLANPYMLEFLRGIPDLSRDERNYWNKKLMELYNKAENLLFESLDNNVSNLDKFNELTREGIIIQQGLMFDSDLFQGVGIFDKKTRVYKFPEPAKTRQGTSGDKAGETPVTLREFMSNYCEQISKNMLESRVKSLQGLAQRKVITLKHTGKWDSGQSKKYLPNYLISNWETFRDKLTSLPRLKQS